MYFLVVGHSSPVSKHSGERLRMCKPEIQKRTKMASSMGGMFPGQQPPGTHPVGVPGGPGQPGLLPGGSANRAQGNNTLVDDLEASFEVGRDHHANVATS